MSTAPVQVLPIFAQKLRTLLRAQGEDALAAQVSELQIVERCRCNVKHCGTSYTVPPPAGAWGPGDFTVDLKADDCFLMVDVVGDRIVCVEVLYHREVIEQLDRLFPLQ